MVMKNLFKDAFKRYMVHITSCAVMQHCDDDHVQVVKLSEDLACSGAEDFDLLLSPGRCLHCCRIMS
jgi:hypothetical protein